MKPPASSFADHRLIWAWDERANHPNAYVEFECLLEEVTGGELLISATTSYRIFLGGDMVHWGPLREVPPYAYVDSFSLDGLEGRQLRLVAHHLGIQTHTHVPGAAGLLLGGQTRVGDDVVDLGAVDRWRVRPLTCYDPQSPRLGTCVGFSEIFDFSAEPAEWRSPVEVARHPWDWLPELLARDLPDFPLRTQEPQARLLFGGGILVDFGQTVFGFVELVFRAEAAVELTLEYAEVLDRGRVDAERHPAVSYRDRVKAPAGRHRWLSYEKRAFRYLQISHPVEMESIRVIESQQPLQPIWQENPALRETRESDPEKAALLETICRVSARTMELCLEDLVLDCPWRERAQYFDLLFWEDAYALLFAGESPTRRFLIQYARGADPQTGRLRMCYPGPPGHPSIVDFSLSYPLLLLRYGQRSGDWKLVESLLRPARAGVEGWSEFDQNHLLVDPKGWIFLDNSDDFLRAPCSAGLNACYYRAFLSLGALEEQCGNAERARQCREKAAQVRAAFREAFLRNGRLLDSTGVPELEARDIWNYHFPADRDAWEWKCHGESFLLTLTLEVTKPTEMHFSSRSGFRVWLDSALRLEESQGSGWGRSVLQSWTGFPVEPGIYRLTIQAAFFWGDWEIWLSTTQKDSIMLHPGVSGRCPWDLADPRVEPQATRDVACASARRWNYPALSQISVGYAAHHGLLEPHEAGKLLTRCLPETYDTPWRKRITPSFASITEDPHRLEKRILPCHVPASAWHFTQALQKYGMHRQATEFCHMLYRGMLERGATTWWEEWENRSSNCHVWACFGLPLIMRAATKC